MAKIKKQILRWAPSASPRVAGYKLYWSVDDKVHYGSESIAVGDVTELVLPDGIQNFRLPEGPVAFAITAVDELGNESDMITLAAPYQFSAPRPPKDFWMESGDDFHAGDAAEEADEDPGPISLFERRPRQMEKKFQAEEAKVPIMARRGMKYPRRCEIG